MALVAYAMSRRHFKYRKAVAFYNTTGLAPNSPLLIAARVLQREFNCLTFNLA